MTERMYLPEVERHPASGPRGEAIAKLRAAGLPVPQIWHLFEFKPDRTRHLERFCHAVMRGPSPLSAGLRELIAAFTSAQNHCPF
jgi:alkylhydroperoxidase family enzyme